MPIPSAVVGRRHVVQLALASAVAVTGGAGLTAVGASALRSPADGLSAPLRALTARGPWLNTSPLLPQDFQGKVVLANVWTYSCINSLRPLPYVRAWAEKYKDRGLVVVGVHTPEFGFEKDFANVRRAVGELDVRYPVVLDSDYAIWRALHNNAWPAFYFIGADGQVHGKVLGEGGYEQSERLIQKLLSAATGIRVTDAIMPVTGTGPQTAPDLRALESDETYVGYSRATGFASPGGFERNSTSVYYPAGRLAQGGWSLVGQWAVVGEFATLKGPSGSIAYRFHARDLNLVLASSASGRLPRFRVRLDGADPGLDRGVDVDAQGWGQVRSARLYQLIRQAHPTTDRTFEIEFFDPDVRAYVFTFG